MAVSVLRALRILPFSLPPLWWKGRGRGVLQGRGRGVPFRGCRICGAIALLILLGGVTSLGAQETGGTPAPAPPRYPVDVEAVPRPTATATRISDPVVLDGRLDEPVWQLADTIGNFIQSQPARGYPATERTVVRLLYDDRALYVGAELFDSEPDNLVVSTLEKDFPGQSTRDVDIFSFTLDPFHDRKNSFIYLVNPLGALRDGQTFDDSRSVDFNWDGVVEVKTTIHERGWTVEMAIPWSSLRYDPALDEQTWGVNFLRRVRRKNEDSYWAPMDRRDPVHRMSKAGTLTGIRGLRATRNLTITPYALAGNSFGRPDAAPEVRDNNLDAGFDLKYGVTPQLTLDLTYNTDFSQVEVDQEQVNLTRFSLFFPEKRDFFVENSGVFAFGDVAEREYRMGSSLRDFTLFHSRRIGLRNGRPVPIVGGGRFTGRMGGFEVGVLDIQTQSAYGLPPENFAVVRLRHPLGAGSDAGVLLVNRQATEGGGFNRSYGADVNVRLFGDVIVNSYLAGTDEPGDGGDNLAGRLSAAWRNRFWDASAFVKQVGEDFEPGVGFVQRRGVRDSYATIGIHPQRPFRGVQEINPYLEIEYITTAGSLLETRTGTAGAEVQFLDGSQLSAVVNDRYERVFDPFRVGASDTVAAGVYDFADARVRYSSSAARQLAFGATVGGGGYFGGTRGSLSAEARWRASPRLSLDASAEYNRVELGDNAFTADVYGGRIKYAVSTQLFGSAFVQYNAALDQIITNARVNFIHAPLSDLFLVYTDRRDSGGRVIERFLTAKVTRLIGF